MNRYLLIPLACLPLLAHATPMAGPFLDELLAQTLLPRYQQLDRNSQALRATLDKTCPAVTPASLRDARQQWQSAHEAWQQVQALNWGPTAALRSQRVIAFRPARPALIEKAVAEQLGQSAEQYEQAGSAAKGFMAIEYALYDTASQLNQPARCDWLRANAAEIARHTPVLLAAWQTTGQTLQAGSDEARQQALEEVVNLTLAGVNELHKELSRLKTQKREAITGQRSQSGKRSLQAQFGLLAAVLQGPQGRGGLSARLPASDAALAANLRQQTNAVSAALNRLPDNLADVGQSGREQAAVEALASLLATIEGPLTHALDITLSFNESDGD